LRSLAVFVISFDLASVLALTWAFLDAAFTSVAVAPVAINTETAIVAAKTSSWN
jgi:hypothetical protein